MKTTKLLFGMVMFLLICISASAIEFPYSNQHWGNTNWISDTTSRTLTGSNNTYCQPFVAYTTGTIKSFFAKVFNSNGVVNWCLSGNLVLPNQGCPTGTGGSHSGFGHVFNRSGEPANLTVTRGDTYYLCVQGDTSQGGSAYVSVGDKDHYSGNDDAGNFSGITTPYDSNWVEGYQTQQGSFYSYDVGGSYTIFAPTGYVFRSLQYCMDDAGDQCHIYSGSSAIPGDGEGLNDLSGQVFQYLPETSSLEEVNFMMMHGTGIAGYTYRVEVYNWDETTNTTDGGLYNSSSIADNNGTWTTGFKWANHTVNASFNLVEDEYYLVGARCLSGCSDNLNQKMHLAYSVWGTSTDWFVQGFQGDAGARYDENIGGDHIETNKDTFFLLKMGDAIRETPPNGDGVGNLSNCTTNCTSWSKPYYLQEEFVGDLSQCDWAVNEEVCYLGKILRVQADDYYTIFKLTDLLEYDKSRYFTVSFDIKPADIDTDGWVGLSLYDYDYVRYINVLFGDNGRLYNNEEGNAVERYTNISTSELKNVKLHVDLVEDEFDVYYGGSKILSDLQFTNGFYNMETLYGVRVTSSEAGYEFQNLSIYGSDQNNNPLIPDEDEPASETIDPTKSWCSLFTNQDITCSSDSDCVFGKCQPHGICSKFDFTYCDDNGYTRGNMCMVSGMTTCVLESLGDIILENFFLFLIFLVLLMLIVYAMIMFRKA
jgi:hypothetical protein